MDLLSWLFLGICIGLIANILESPSSKVDIISTLLLGSLGAVLGGLLAGLLFNLDISRFNLEALSMAIIGTMTVLFGDKVIKKFS